MDEADLFQRFDVTGLKSARQRSSSRKISESVFDKDTLMALYKLAKKEAFTEITGVVSTGKEASVYHGLRDGEDVALKIYKNETSDFRHMSKYIRGDPRFASWKNRRQLVQMWAQKEYKNLSRVCEKVRCPKPIEQHKNVLVMEFIGDGGVPAPKLKEEGPSDPGACYREVMGFVGEMYKLRLVHADLSEYNILDYGGAVVIDFSAGVLLDHPRSMEFLQRDVGNIVNYFSKLGVEADYGTALKGVLDAR
ncbi:MAG: serine protein kinase RIO [Candidatus Altiarchaeales archaeon]|nr:serine protein kinase RIO [Candidatus Altiarchaeales archaeon]MBD3416496.1 serine protein kinase RIO [Candidatus Altiarchaeales archaeon]